MKLTYAVLGALLLLTTLLRLPAFFQPAWYGDEGIFAAVAHGLRQGDLLYSDVWDNKPPGIFLVYIAGSLTGLDMLALRLTDLAATLATQVFVFLIARRVAGSGPALTAAGICGVLLGLPTFEGHIVNTEVFMTLLVSGGMYLLIRGLDAASDRPLALLPAGVAFGAALLFKQIAVLETAAAATFLVLYLRGFPGGSTVLGSRCGPLAGFVAGIALLPALSAGVFLAAGAFDDFWHATVRSLVGYRGGGLSTQEALVLLLPLAIALPFAVAAQPWRTRSLAALLPLWLAFAALGVGASGRAYPHYLLPLAAPLSLLLVTWLASRPRIARASVAAGLAVSCLAVYHVFIGPLGWVAWNQEPAYTRAYYRNFVDYATGDRSREDYEAFFDRNTPGRTRLMAELRDLDLDGREVFVWGDLAWLYPEADLVNPTRYVTLFQATDQEGGSLGAALLLLRTEPQHVLVLESAASQWLDVYGLLAEAYSPVATLEGATLYARVVGDVSPPVG